MKLLIIFASILMAISSAAQQTEAFYDFNWQPCKPSLARYYSTVKKTDSGWLRHDYFITGPTLQMQVLCADKDCKVKNGEAFYFYASGQLSSKGRLVQNKPEGIYIRYHSNSMMSDSASYHNGVPIGSRTMWHRNGYISDSIYHSNDSMDIHLIWFDNGGIAAAGYLLRGKQHGKWKYHHANGNLAGEIVFNNGVELSQKYFNEDGSAQPNTDQANRSASFKKGGDEGWKKYIYKNLYWPKGLKLENTTEVTVGVEFWISADGKIIDAEVTVPFHPEFDKIALSAMRNSPDWNPALQHNRKVKQRFRQSVTFQQEE